MSEQVIGQFVKALRGAEVAVSTSETLDAVRVAALIGYEHRQSLKQGLAMVLAKSETDKLAFDECFDAFFRFETRPAGSESAVPSEPLSLLDAMKQWMPGQQGGGSGAAADSELGQAVLNDDAGMLNRKVAEAIKAAGVEKIQVITQKGLYGRRVMQALGSDALDQEIIRLAKSDVPADRRLEKRLRDARQQLREQVREQVAAQFLLQAREHGRQLRENTIREVNLRLLSEFRGVHQQIERMARRLARKHGRRQQRARRGRLDGRRTTVTALQHGGVPAALHWRRRRRQKPKLMVICDVSSSVSAAARFLLMFLHAVNDVVPSVRSFVFASRFAEVTALFDSLPPEKAIAEVMDRYAGPGTDYGGMLQQFVDLCDSRIDRHTTIIILGDARNNELPPQQQLLAHIGQRCHQLFWLNPEARGRWGSGDSVMPLYEPYCREAFSCSSLAGLERFVDRLLRDIARDAG